jgi:hypothetical protein
MLHEMKSGSHRLCDFVATRNGIVSKNCEIVPAFTVCLHAAQTCISDDAIMRFFVIF